MIPRSNLRRIPLAPAIASAALVLCARLAGAQNPPRIPGTAPHDSIVISVLTMGPGEEMFERFGHQSIRIHDLTTGLDSAYNWGMFSFEQPHFIARFLTGDTKYWMQGFPSVWLIHQYRDLHRAVWEQQLSLTRLEKDSLWKLIKINATEEHKWYRYDYYRDNCATRVRDILDLVLGGGIQRAVAAREHGVTLRGETLRLSRAYPMINFGMDFVLGRPADDTLSAWDEMFVPMRLQQLIRSLRVRHSDGTVRRLVRSERQLVVDARYTESTTVPEYFSPAFIVGLGVAGAVLALCIIPGWSAPQRLYVAVIGACWHLLAGTVGMLLLLAELFTRHAAYMGHNVNVLLATPASLALAVLYPLAMWKGASPKVIHAARALSVFTAACAILAVFLRLVPSLAQQNRPFLALAVPLHAVLAFALWRATIVPAADPAIAPTAVPGEIA